MRRTSTTARSLGLFLIAAFGLLVALASMLLAADASPATESAPLPRTRVDSITNVSAPPYLSVYGERRRSDVKVKKGPDGDFLITDAMAVLAGERCESLDQRTAVCDRITGEGGILADLREGNDRMRIIGRGVFAEDVDGGEGRDKLEGGDVADTLVGGRGADTLRGHRGRDRVGGLEGHDRMFGGRGPDRLFAVDGERDKVIDCGRGSKDRAKIDRDIDPEPRGCETVLYE